MSELLIVDDTLTNLHLLMELMSGQGYSVRTATSGPMALESVQVSAPDLILLDINMPQMDGYEVCRQLKANPKTKAIPVIFLSALSTTLDKVKAFEVGGIDYVTKPFHMEEILIRVKTQLSLRQMSAQLEEQLKTRSNQLNQTQLQLLQQEKMASLGILSAGIGHEINNPLNFIKHGAISLKEELQSKKQTVDYDQCSRYISMGINKTGKVGFFIFSNRFRITVEMSTYLNFSFRVHKSFNYI